MAKVEHIIRVELTPHDPVHEIMQVVSVMLKSNPGREAAVLSGLSEAVEVLQTRYVVRQDQEKGDELSGK